MNNLNIVRGLFILAIALIFGIWSTAYQIGQFSRSGPGLFPLLLSCLLGVIGVITLVRAWFVQIEPVNANFKNIAVIILALVFFTLVSHHLNMILGVIVLVFLSAFAGKNYSVLRNLKVTTGLLVIAFIFKNLLGLNLPLY
jgi:hypothetical protein